MNRFKYLFLVAYVLCAIGMLAVTLTFVACSSGDDGGAPTGNSGNNGNGGSNSALAVFTCNTGYDNRTLTFYNDSTFKVIVSDESEPQAAGTYKFVSGDWENGTITLNATSGSKASTFTGTKTISEKKITFSSKTYILTGGSLKTPSDESGNSGKEPSQTEKKLLAEYNYDNLSLISFYSNNTFEFKYSDRNYGKESGTYSLVGNWNNGCVAIKNSSTSNYPKIESGVHVISDGVLKISDYKYSVKEIASGSEKNIIPSIVYLPEEYSDKGICGLFVKNFGSSTEFGNTACFFFTDNTYVMTKKTISESGISTSVSTSGTYTGSLARTSDDIEFTSSDGTTGRGKFKKDSNNNLTLSIRKSGLYYDYYNFNADILSSKEAYLSKDKIYAIYSLPVTTSNNITKEEMYVFYFYDSASEIKKYEELQIYTSGNDSAICVASSGTWNNTGDYADCKFTLDNSSSTVPVENGILTISETKYTISYPEYNNSAVSSGKAAFKGTVLGEEIIVKFDSGKYEQWRNGLPDGKGTYSMTGDFTDGTMTLVEKEEYKSGEWQKKSSYETRNFTISNGTLKNNTYGTFEAIDYDYDVSRDRLGGSASDENTAAQFAAILYDSYNSAILTFHKDGTYEWVIYHKNKKLGIDVKETGTYSLTDGDFTNGTVTLKIHEVYSNEKEKMVSITDESEHPRCISRNRTSHSYISYIDEFTTEWKIENGKVTFDYYNTTTMIKQ